MYMPIYRTFYNLNQNLRYKYFPRVPQTALSNVVVLVAGG